MEEVTSRMRSIAKEFSPAIDVAQVVANDGEADHVELLVTISGCHDEACTIMVNVPRDRDSFEGNLRSCMRDAIDRHAMDGAVHPL